jgi:hypothetical protein
VELQDAINQVKGDKENHLNQRKASSIFVALVIWLKQALGMRIGELSLWEDAIQRLDAVTNLMAQFERQAGSVVEWWVKMDNTFKAAESSISGLNTKLYSKARMEGLEKQLGMMNDEFSSYQFAVCLMFFQLLSALIKSSACCPVGSHSRLLFSLIR